MTDPTARWGMTIPLSGPLHTQRERYEQLESLGYTDLWTAEAMGVDGLTPLALASVWTPSMRLGTAILPAYTRGPALMAQSVAGLAEAAPGRFAIGIGSSSNIIVESWNGIPFEQPFHQTRDMVRFLKAALTGEKVTATYETFEIQGFRLAASIEEQPKILVAALREGMLRMAGRESDGAIINWLSATDVATVAPIVRESNPDAEIVARIFVIPTEDADVARGIAKRAAAAYLNVPVYRAFHEWLGRSDELGDMWRLWGEGDRKGALAAIPDEVVDELILHGTPDQIRAKVQAYVDNGVSTPVLAPMNVPDLDDQAVINLLAP